MFACIYIPNASGDTSAALLACASAFSPRVENTGGGTAVFDVDGLERLFGGYSEIAQQVQEQVHAHGLAANVAIAPNADAAVCAARGFGGVTIIQRGMESARLHDLPITVLGPSTEILETLERWGIRTLGAFAKLPAIQISERLGREGIHLHKLAHGAGVRPIVPHAETLRFVEVMELDYEIIAIEPLTFILSRMLDQICSRLRSRNLATHEVILRLGNYVRILNLPLPVRNARLLTRLFILDLEAHPTGAPIQRVEVEAIPVKPRVVQNGLFVPLSPEPEKLQLTLARLKAVVGEENVGSPEILDTHRPDAFRMGAGGGKGEGGKEGKGSDPRWQRDDRLETLSLSREGSDPLSPLPHFPSSPFPAPTSPRALTLRLFRPPLEATVQLGNGLPIWIAFHGKHGSIATANGPWHTSGDWWRPTMWDREEWDIEVTDALYRIYYDVHLDRWYAQGIYD
jgi:protein ImuB